MKRDDLIGLPLEEALDIIRSQGAEVEIMETRPPYPTGLCGQNPGQKRVLYAGPPSGRLAKGDKIVLICASECK